MSDFEEFWNESVEGLKPLTGDQKRIIDAMLEEIHIEENMLKGIRIMLCQSPTEEDGWLLISHLNDLRPSPITHSKGYSMSDVVKHVKEISQ